MTSEHQAFEFDLDLIRSQLTGWDLHFFEELGSTNDWALQEFHQRELLRPAVILAKRQTSGRGRGEHQWQAPPGNLTFTLVLTLDQPLGSPATAIPSSSLSPAPAVLNWPARLALATPLAIRQTIADLVPFADCRIKWPNDLLIDNQKLAGILIESLPALQTPPSGHRGRTNFAIGIGLNVNAAPDLSSGATQPARLAPTSLAIVLKRPLDLTNVFVSLLSQLTRWYELVGVFQREGTLPEPLKLLEAYNRVLCWRGERVTLLRGNQPITGLLVGVNQAGHLELQTPDGLINAASGELRLAGKSE